MNTFTFGESDDEHQVGDHDCDAGWCENPLPACEEDGCGGLIHANFGDENRDGDYWLWKRCDKCEAS